MRRKASAGTADCWPERGRLHQAAAGASRSEGSCPATKARRADGRGNRQDSSRGRGSRRDLPQAKRAGLPFSPAEAADVPPTPCIQSPRGPQSALFATGVLRALDLLPAEREGSMPDAFRSFPLWV